MDYDTLVGTKGTTGSIRDWINYDRVPTEQVLEEAEQLIYKRIRTSEMRVSDKAVAIAQDATFIPKPDKWQETVVISIPGYNPRLRYKDADSFYELLALDDNGEPPSGTPTMWALYDERMNFDTKADQAYTAHHIYYKSLDPLSSSNQENFLTIEQPTLLRRACMLLGAEYRKDWDMFDRYTRLFEGHIFEVNQEADREKAGMELDMHWNWNTG